MQKKLGALKRLGPASQPWKVLFTLAELGRTMLRPSGMLSDLRLNVAGKTKNTKTTRRNYDYSLSCYPHVLLSIRKCAER